jgi:hypothetical protein
MRKDGVESALETRRQYKSQIECPCQKPEPISIALGPSLSTCSQNPVRRAATELIVHQTNVGREMRLHLRALCKEVEVFERGFPDPP